MRILADLNVLLDVAQNRIPHYSASEEVLRRARLAEYEALIPAHAITTLHYVLRKWSGLNLAEQTICSLLASFTVAPADSSTFQRALDLSFPDFEDPVVAALAESSHCDYIVSRNSGDFLKSPVPAISPAQFLELLQAQKP